MSPVALVSSAMEAIKSDSFYKDKYIHLLEADLATARHRIIMLKAKCAILGDTGDAILPPTPPASLAPSSSPVSRPTSITKRLNHTSSSELSRVAGLRRSRRESGRVGVSIGPNTPPQKRSDYSSSSRKRSVSFAALPTPSPIKKAVPGATNVLPPPAIKRHMAQPYCCCHTPPAVSATPHIFSRTKIPRHFCRHFPSTSRHQPHPATGTGPSLGSTTSSPPASEMYLRSRRRRTQEFSPAKQLKISADHVSKRESCQRRSRNSDEAKGE
jgi:hypothetical protein